MERLCLPLLLSLLSLVSGAHLQNNRTQGNLVKVEQTQSCPPDLHSILIDLSVKLTLLQTKFETLEKEKIEQFKTQMDSQQREVKSRLEKNEYEVDILRKDREDGRVAFFVARLLSDYGDFGPYKLDTTLIFKQVFSNIGGAYNNLTGIFTAPHRGLYSFDFFIPGNTPGSHVILMKNAEVICPTSGHTMILQLQLGDQVYLRLRTGSKIYDAESYYSTFSGRLLFLL